MTTMYRKTRVSSDRRVLKLASKARTGTSRLIRHLDEQLAADGWDVPPSHVEGLNESVVQVLETRNERLAEAICERREVASRGKDLRRRRDEACREVYRLLVRLRKMIHAGAGDVAVRAHFGSGKTPREPWEVWRLATNLHQATRNSPGSLCGQIGSEETLLNWARVVEEPLTRLGSHLREVERIEEAERRAVGAVRQAKDEMRQTQKFAYRLLEGIYGLAGLEQEGKDLRVREPGTSKALDSHGARAATGTRETSSSGQAEADPPSETAAPGLGRAERTSETPETGLPAAAPTTRTKSPGPPGPGPTTETTASGPAPSPPTSGTTAFGIPSTLRFTESSELRPAGVASTSGSGEPGLPGSTHSTGTTSPGMPGRGLASAMAGSGPVTDPGRVPEATAPLRGVETEPLDAAPPRVWKVFELLRRVPHRGGHGGEPLEIAGPEERAA